MSAAPRPVYLDYNATAPLLPEAAERMRAALGGEHGNPSSPHAFGQAARDRLETLRAGLARHLGCSRRELLFTSGGSEANNWLLRWPAWLDEPAHVITSPIEHPSVLESARWLEGRGVAVSWLPVDADGVVQVDAVADLLRPETRVVSVMAANNETGVIQPIERLVQTVRAAQGERPVLVHSDAVQAFGRIPFDPRVLGLDAVTVAAHKLAGPKGIGAAMLREGLNLPGFVLGGRQERGRRAGTESVLLAEGFAAAADHVFAAAGLAGRLAALRDRLEAALADEPGVFVNGAGAPRLPNTSNIGFEGVSAESLLVALDLQGVAVSTGSACSSGAVEPSHVLRAMGVPEGRLRSALRISLGWGTSEDDVARCAEVLREEVRRLRARARRAAG